MLIHSTTTHRDVPFLLVAFFFTLLLSLPFTTHAGITGAYDNDGAGASEYDGSVGGGSGTNSTGGSGSGQNTDTPGTPGTAENNTSGGSAIDSHMDTEYGGGGNDDSGFGGSDRTSDDNDPGGPSGNDNGGGGGDNPGRTPGSGYTPGAAYDNGTPVESKPLTPAEKLMIATGKAVNTIVTAATDTVNNAIAEAAALKNKIILGREATPTTNDTGRVDFNKFADATVPRPTGNDANPEPINKRDFAALGGGDTEEQRQVAEDGKAILTWRAAADDATNPYARSEIQKQGGIESNQDRGVQQESVERDPLEDVYNQGFADSCTGRECAGLGDGSAPATNESVRVAQNGDVVFDGQSGEAPETTLLDASEQAFLAGRDADNARALVEELRSGGASAEAIQDAESALTQAEADETAAQARLNRVSSAYQDLIDPPADTEPLTGAATRGERGLNSGYQGVPTGVPKIGEDLEQFVIEREGFSSIPFDDFKQISIGHGTEARPGDTVIDEAEAARRLRSELVVFAGAVDEHVTVPLTENQRNALISFTYNVGVGHPDSPGKDDGEGLLGSSLLTKLNSGDYESVPSEMERWRYAGGKVNDGLVNRRAEEIKLFTTPDGSTPESKSILAAAAEAATDLISSIRPKPRPENIGEITDTAESNAPTTSIRPQPRPFIEDLAGQISDLVDSLVQ